MTRWGKAGVRLDPAEADARAQRIAARRSYRRGLAAGERAEGERLWRAGKLVPAAITMWLDHRGLGGPEVDVACGAAEPDVDHWEAGILYPSLEQTLLLAELVGVTVTRLCAEPMNAVFICPPPRQPVAPPVLRFTQGALERRLVDGLDGPEGRLF